MSDKGIVKRHYKTFEELKRLADGNVEFWYARDLQVALDYSSWDKFKRVVLKAISACENILGKAKANTTHFEVGKKVRQTIEELGGTMSEDLPTPDEDLKKLERRTKKHIKGGNHE